MGKDKEIHTAYLPVAFERSLDLGVRAQQASQLQMFLSQFVIELLSNGHPLTIGLKIERQKPLDEQDQFLVLIYWQEARVNEMTHQMDLTMLRRCVKCGNMYQEDHKCSPLAQSPGPEEKADAPGGILRLETPLTDETEPASTD